MLFAFAIIVACDKDTDDNYDSSSINPIEAQVEVSDDTMSIVNALVSRLENGLPSDKGVRGTSGLTARSGDNCGVDDRSLSGYTNYISYEIFTDATTSNNFGLIRSEENIPVSDQISPFLTVWLAQDGSGNDFDVIVNGAVVSSGNSAGLIGLMAVPNLRSMEALNAAFIFTGVGDVTIADCTAAAAASWTENPSDAGLFELAGIGSYRLTPAPFPLTGMLATVVSKDDSANVVANYAGTTADAVNTAIRADFVD